MRQKAILITGGNLGDVRTNLERAKDIITRRVGRIIAESSVVESEPWGFEAQEKFLNQVLVVETELFPQKLLSAILRIEAGLGRVRGDDVPGSGKAYVSRTMDIDILFYGEMMVESESLTIPHPRMHLRRFVLEPLVEVAPGWVHPGTGKTVERMYRELIENEKV